jgi:hypothetical protein
VGARWRIACCTAVVAIGILVTGARAPAQTPPLRVSMFGDSVLLGAKEELLAAFSDQQATVDAVEDRSLLGTIGLFQNSGLALGDVVVLDLGYNDAADAAVFRSRVDGAMSALSGVKRVIWLNQHDWGPGRAGMNAELTAAAARYPNLEVVDWNAEVAAHPEYVYADAIHLTPAGQTAMAALVRKQFDHRGASTTTTIAPSTAAPTTTTVAPAASTTVPASSSDDSGLGGREIALIVAAVVAVALGAVLVVSARRRAARRAARRADRGARRGH